MFRNMGTDCDATNGKYLDATRMSYSAYENVCNLKVEEAMTKTGSSKYAASLRLAKRDIQLLGL
jgi:hypothetical protein